MMEKLVQWTIVACLGLLPLSCWQRDDFGADLAILPALRIAPDQQRANHDPFSVQLNDVNYRIEPLYEYDLHGLVVSYRHHDGGRMLHRLWNDHLNVADLCVVWGRNATDLDLNAFDFWSGEFTCFFRTRDNAAWRRFDAAAISNNHLITEDGYLRDRIDAVRIGDQIHVKGWLASYSNGNGFRRGTSTTRTDTGNGACETIYVTRFEILSSMSNAWRGLFDLALVGLLTMSALWLVTVLRGGFRHRADA